MSRRRPGDIFAAVIYRGTDMDLLMILFTLAFFIVAISYTIACDKLK